MPGETDTIEHVAFDPSSISGPKRPQPSARLITEALVLHTMEKGRENLSHV